MILHINHCHHVDKVNLLLGGDELGENGVSKHAVAYRIWSEDGDRVAVELVKFLLVVLLCLSFCLFLNDGLLGIHILVVDTGVCNRLVWGDFLVLEHSAVLVGMEIWKF